jgi:tmRNA-binding protein
MTPTIQSSNLQTFLCVFPLVLLLVASIFKLDVAVARGKTTHPARALVPVSQTELQTVMTDPDGRPWDQN